MTSRREVTACLLSNSILLALSSSQRILADPSISTVVITPQVSRDVESWFDDLPLDASYPTLEKKATIVDPITLPNSNYAGGDIMMQLNIPYGFDPTIDYSEARQCSQQFEAILKEWVKYLDGISDINRSPQNRDVAFSIGAKFAPEKKLAYMKGATQYQNLPAVELMANELPVLSAANRVLNRYEPARSSEISARYAVIKKGNIQHRKRTPAKLIETPHSVIVGVRKSRLGQAQSKPLVGVIIAAKKDRSGEPTRPIIIPIAANI